MNGLLDRPIMTLERLCHRANVIDAGSIASSLSTIMRSVAWRTDYMLLSVESGRF